MICRRFSLRAATLPVALLSAVLLANALMPAIGRAQVPLPTVDLNDPAVIAAGNRYFNGRCAGKCHGLDGYQGEDAPAVRNKEYLSPMFVYVTILGGRPGSAMPSWKDRISDDDLWRVIAYVVSIAK